MLIFWRHHDQPRQRENNAHQVNLLVAFGVETERSWVGAALGIRRINTNYYICLGASKFGGGIYYLTYIHPCVLTL